MFLPNASGRKIPKVLHWVNASPELHCVTAIKEGGLLGLDSTGESPGLSQLLCEPSVQKILLAMKGTDCQMVQFERLGLFEVEEETACQSEAVQLSCVKTLTPKRWRTLAPLKPSKRQYIPCKAVKSDIAGVSVRAALISKTAESKLQVGDYVLMVTACERWEQVMSLDVELAWRQHTSSSDSLAQIGQGVFWASKADLSADMKAGTTDRPQAVPNASMLQGTFDQNCGIHIAGLQRCLKLICEPQASAHDLVKAVEEANLAYPHGWSLEQVGPHPARCESLAPYLPVSAFLPMAISRSIHGPIMDRNSSTSNVEEPASLVILEVVGPRRMHILAQDVLSGRRFDFSPSLFCSSWRLRPFPDYSAALEPLAALALIGIGIRTHALLQDTS